MSKLVFSISLCVNIIFLYIHFEQKFGFGGGQVRHNTEQNLTALVMSSSSLLSEDQYEFILQTQETTGNPMVISRLRVYSEEVLSSDQLREADDLISWSTNQTGILAHFNLPGFDIILSAKRGES